MQARLRSDDFTRKPKNRKQKKKQINKKHFGLLDKNVKINKIKTNLNFTKLRKFELYKIKKIKDLNFTKHVYTFLKHNYSITYSAVRKIFENIMVKLPFTKSHTTIVRISQQVYISIKYKLLI